MKFAMGEEGREGERTGEPRGMRKGLWICCPYRTLLGHCPSQNDLTSSHQS
jgi:hypothetical protein